MNKEELKILESLDRIVRWKFVTKEIDSIVLRVERKLTQDPVAVLGWEPVPLAVYRQNLRNMIRSSWVFVVSAQATTGAERHPNSYQCMMSYRGSGDIQIWSGEGWHSNLLVSDANIPIERRRISISANVWHQAVVTEENWVVVSFHTISEDELIEERLGTTDAELIHRRRYVDELE